jgi:hypothetical protein
VNAAQPSAEGLDSFAGKNWNAPRHNNMYDRWEFNADGTFHFWHVHEGKPLDRGVFHYEAKDGFITINKEGEYDKTVYTYKFNGKTVTITPVSVENAPPPDPYRMGALPDKPVTYRLAR